MSWRNGSAYAPLGAANTAITVTTTTAIASGERVILVVWRQQAAAGTAAGNPTVSTLGGNAFTTVTINELFISLYSGISIHSFIAPGAISSGATMTVTPGHANQKVSAFLIVQGDPHPTQAPFANVAFGRNQPSALVPLNSWQGMDEPHRGLTWDKRLLVTAVAELSGSASSPWSQTFTLTNTPINGFTEALDTTQFSYGFAVNVREDASTDSLPSEFAGSGSGGSYGSATTMTAFANFIRAGAVDASLGPDVYEYSDFPSSNLPGAGARPLVGQLWPR